MSKFNASSIAQVKALRALVFNHDAFYHCHSGRVAAETLVNFRNGDKLLLRPRNGQAVADSDIFKEVILNNAYSLERLDVEGARVLDIGAHTGMFAIAALRFGAGRVIAIEPDTQNFKTLQHNTALNDHYRIYTHRAAVANVRGRLVRSALNSGAHHFIPGETSGPGDQDGAILTPRAVDDLIEKHQVAVLKVDCEGCEACVFRDCQNLSSLRLVVVESHDRATQWWQRRFIEDRLSSLGFSIEVLRESNLAEGNFAILKAAKLALT